MTVSTPPLDPDAPRPLVRHPLALLGGLAIAYLVTGWAGLLLAIPPGNATAVWPPSGIAVAALYLGGLRLWPAIFFGTLVVTAFTEAPLLAGIGFGIGNALEGLAAAVWLRRSGFDAVRMSRRDVASLVVVAGGVCGGIGALIGALSLTVTGIVDWTTFALTLWTWWGGDALGVILVAPLVLVWATATPAERREKSVELAIVLAATAVLSWAVFQWAPETLYLTFLPLVWAASRLGLRGAVSVSVLAWVIGAWSALPAEAGSTATVPVIDRSMSQLYFAVHVLVGMLLAGAVNERDRTRQRLRAREQWSRSVLEQGSDVLTVIDRSGVIRYATAAAERVLGLRPQDLVGTRAIDHVHPQDVRHVRLELAQLAAKPGATAVIRARCLHPEHGWRILEGLGTNALDDANVRGMILSVRDVTEQADEVRMLSRAREAATESARLRSEFLANVSHELRTPLNVVFGMTDMLLDSPLTDAQEKQTRAVQESAGNLLHLIDDILDLAKIDSGRLEMQRHELRLRPLIEDAAHALEFRAAAKGLTLETDVASSLGMAVWGDPTRLRQVIFNYLSNAIKFTDRGTVRITAKPIDESPDGVEVLVEVSDTGVGIPEDRMHRLFQPFSQVDGSMTRHYGGTGLGLAISKQLAEMMGGGVGVTSTPGRGSTFWFTTRLEKAAPVALELQRSAAARAPDPDVAST